MFTYDRISNSFDYSSHLAMISYITMDYLDDKDVDDEEWLDWVKKGKIVKETFSDVIKTYIAETLEPEQKQITTDILADVGQRRQLRMKALANPRSLTLLEGYTHFCIDKCNRGFLWKVTYQTNSVFLLGVSHYILLDKMLPEESVHPKVMQVLDESDTLYVELSQEEMQADEKFVAEVTADVTAATIRDWQNPQKILSKSNSYAFRRYKKSLGLDINLQSLALKKGKTVCSLETTVIQLRSLKKIFQEKFDVERVLDLIDSVQWNNLLQITEIFEEYSDKFKEAVNARNPRMANQIMAKLRKGEKALFAVGACHFIGKKGILALLQKKGCFSCFKDESIEIEFIDLK